jgi:hypothetical protein
MTEQQTERRQALQHPWVWVAQGGNLLLGIVRIVAFVCVATPVVHFWLLVVAVTLDPQLAATPLGESTWGQVLGAGMVRVTLLLALLVTLMVLVVAGGRVFGFRDCFAEWAGQQAREATHSQHPPVPSKSREAMDFLAV